MKFHLIIMLVMVAATAAAMAFTACNGNNAIRKAASVIGLNNPSDVPGMENPNFFPIPKEEQAVPINWRNGDVLAIACIGQFNTISDLLGSDFYGLLCDRYPALKGIDRFSVDVDSASSTVWLLIPRHPSTSITISQHNEATSKAKVLYTATHMKPMLVRTSMQPPGAIQIQAKASNVSTLGATTWIPAFTSPHGHVLGVADGVLPLQANNFMKRIDPYSYYEQQPNSELLLELCADGQLFLSVANRNMSAGTYVAYTCTSGEDVLAVTMADGRKAIWTLVSCNGSGSQFVLKEWEGSRGGNVLPSNAPATFTAQKNNSTTQ